MTKIVVAVKYVPDATANRSFNADNTVDRDGVDGLLSELDEYAVEQALQIIEAGEGEVTVLTVGPDDAADAIRKALQMGADAGVHVKDDAIHGSDAFATSLVLAEAIKKLDYDLLFFGMTSTDGGMGVVPTLVAERLGVPAVTFASEVTVDGDTVKIRRDGDVAAQTVEATGKVVVSVTDQTGEARYPSFKGIMAAKKKEVQEWSLADLGLDAASVGLDNAWSKVESFEPRPARTAGEIVTDEGDGGTKLAEFLASKKFV
ncbi:electron transfer flavoprotein beta subunit [Aeromicrobium panaciterrae]|uniref:Electron transfer flavoprotein subunit beta n=1 Tax=Aeromicrobium panaciterrae TaxID=363861 RepID=A0ABU1UQQ3_9ACTN|nr:electron transfer flavoprotein subunit beta/FixA family protein [Aeromicrobium panaciterrae]MDR7087514.1 electron transfer flavoprotein beta subunit [Aeromicrobium panaciterrae]